MSMTLQWMMVRRGLLFVARRNILNTLGQFMKTNTMFILVSDYFLVRHLVMTSPARENLCRVSVHGVRMGNSGVRRIPARQTDGGECDGD